MNLGRAFLGDNTICEALTLNNIDLLYVLYYEHMFCHYRNNRKIHYAIAGKGAPFYLSKEKRLFYLSGLDILVSEKAIVTPALMDVKKVGPCYRFKEEAEYGDMDEALARERASYGYWLPVG